MSIINLSALNPGRLCAETASGLASEGLFFLAEGVPASVTCRDYRTPGRSANCSRRFFLGSVALTQQRIAAFAFQARLLNVRFDDELFARLSITVPRPRRLLVSFAAEDFSEQRRGQVEYLFYTRQARTIERHLKNEGSTSNE